jgi:hypothetical protein
VDAVQDFRHGNDLAGAFDLSDALLAGSTFFGKDGSLAIKNPESVLWRRPTVWPEITLNGIYQTAGKPGLPGSGSESGCEFGACGSVGSDFAAGAATTPLAWCAGNPIACGGAIARFLPWVVLTTMALNMEGDARPRDYFAEPKVDYIAKAMCVDRAALGELIHQAKKNRQKGKGSDLTEEEIKELARELPKIAGCTPTMQ